MKHVVDIPEGYMIKVVKEDVEPKNSNEISDNQFEFNGVVFKRGDVIIRNDGTMGILESIQKRSYSPMPFLPLIDVDVPVVYAAFVPSNKKGERVFINIDEAHHGIGTMKGYRHATDEEKSNMLKAMQEEKHFSYDFLQNDFKYIPTVGDLCIFWDNGSESEAIIAELTCTDNSDDYPFLSSTGSGYEKCVKFISDNQYKAILNEEE